MTELLKDVGLLLLGFLRSGLMLLIFILFFSSHSWTVLLCMSSSSIPITCAVETPWTTIPYFGLWTASSLNAVFQSGLGLGVKRLLCDPIRWLCDSHMMNTNSSSKDRKNVQYQSPGKLLISIGCRWTIGGQGARTVTWVTNCNIYHWTLLRRPLRAEVPSIILCVKKWNLPGPQRRGYSLSL